MKKLLKIVIFITILILSSCAPAFWGLTTDIKVRSYTPGYYYYGGYYHSNPQVYQRTHRNHRNNDRNNYQNNSHRSSRNRR